MSNDQPKDFQLSQTALLKLAGFFGLALPIALVALGLIFSQTVQGSISAYYDDPRTRGIFVGALWAIGVILWAYKGYDKIDDRAGKVVCVLAMLVSLFPHDGVTWLGTIKHTTPFLGTIHYTSAVSLFAVLAYFCLFLFTKTKNPNVNFWGSFDWHFHFPEIKAGDVQKRKRNIVYVVCGLFMLSCMALLGLYTMLKLHTTFIIQPMIAAEWLMIWAFSIAWSVKGEWGPLWGWLKDKKK